MRTILETARLVLREMTDADAENLFALRRSPNVMRFIPGEAQVASREEALAVLRTRVFPQYALGFGRWACIERTSGAYVGWSGVKYLAESDEHDISETSNSAYFSCRKNISEGCSAVVSRSIASALTRPS